MSAISGFSSTNPTSSSGPNAFNELTSGQFLQIIFTELANQDPFEPNDSQAMLQQLATIRSIEADTQMSNKMGALVRQNELAASASLIGSLVSGITLDNRRVADLVISVSQTADGPVLNLFDGSRMFFSQVDEIVGRLDNGPPSDDDDDDDTDDTDDGEDDPGYTFPGLTSPTIGLTPDNPGPAVTNNPVSEPRTGAAVPLP